jgi:polyvinyl alcohol dehydrogenase (cytochrome)
MKRLRILIVGLSLLCCNDAAFTQNKAKTADWPMYGQNPANTAYNPRERIISTHNVGQLAVKWAFTTSGDVSARAAVVDGVVYFPDRGGFLWALNATNGQVIWSHPLSDYDLPPETWSRTTPAVVEGTLYLGTQQGAWLLAINAATGALVWKTQLESPADDPRAIITTSPAVAGGVVYTGVASTEESVAVLDPAYQCCKARGSVVAVNAATGKIKWKTYTTPQGYSGAGVWGSNPVVDEKSDTVFISTGNNYSEPKPDAKSSRPGMSYGDCISAGGAAANCSSPDNYVDAIIALNIRNGSVKWGRKLVTWNQNGVTDGSDNFNAACFKPPFTNCPSKKGPDYDFGCAPNLITYQTRKGPKTILGAGQKSGIYYALDPRTGAILWQTKVGPGSGLGGMEWGTASDGKRIYAQITNFYGIPSPAGGNAGSWAALDPATGAILWQKPDPNGAIALGPMTVANGVVYASSMGGVMRAKPQHPYSAADGAAHASSMEGPVGEPTMFALDAANGDTLWSFAAGSSVNAGATVVDGVVYWGSGYGRLGIGVGLPGWTGNNKFYAFSLNGNERP